MKEARQFFFVNGFVIIPSSYLIYDGAFRLNNGFPLYFSLLIDYIKSMHFLFIAVVKSAHLQIFLIFYLS